MVGAQDDDVRSALVAAAVDELMAALLADPKLAEAFVRTR